MVFCKFTFKWMRWVSKDNRLWLAIEQIGKPIGAWCFPTSRRRFPPTGFRMFQSNDRWRRNNNALWWAINICSSLARTACSCTVTKPVLLQCALSDQSIESAADYLPTCRALVVGLDERELSKIVGDHQSLWTKYLYELCLMYQDNTWSQIVQSLIVIWPAVLGLNQPP